MNDLNQREKTSIAIAAISIFAAGGGAVLIFLGFTSGLSGPLASLVGYAILALFVLLGIGALVVYIVFALVARGWK